MPCRCFISRKVIFKTCLFLFMMPIFSMLLATACSKDLSRDKASELIKTYHAKVAKENPQYPSNIQAWIVNMAEVDMGQSDSKDGPFFFLEVEGGFRFEQKQKQQLVDLERTGLITKRFVENKVTPHGKASVWTIELTPKSQRYVLKTVVEVGYGGLGSGKLVKKALVETLSVSGVEITGVSKESEGERLVEFVLKYEPTPFGQVLLDKKEISEKEHKRGEAVVRLYDDGWRIERTSSKGN